MTEKRLQSLVICKLFGVLHADIIYKFFNDKISCESGANWSLILDIAIRNERD